MNKLSAIDIANYFLVLVNRKEGDAMTHLKLQKLLYFAQGTSLALNGILLFDEPLKAWPHGPVSSSVYSKYKVFENNSIPQPPEIDFDIYNNDIKYLIYKVYKEYGEHSASYLRNISHSHTAWKRAFYENADKIIDYSDVKLDFTKSNLILDLTISNSDRQIIDDVEDEWWMSYDCGEPSEDISEYLIEQMYLLRNDKESYINSCVRIEGF